MDRKTSKYLFRLFLIITTLVIQSSLSFSQLSFYSVEPTSIGSQDFDEISPMPFKDGLLYCSNKKTEILRSDLTKEDKQLFNIYYVPKKDDKWGTPQPFSTDVNTRFNEGPAVYNEKTNTLWYTQNINKANKESNFLGIFYASVNKDGSVYNMQSFPFNSEEYNVAYPALSEDGKTLFFCTDKSGGQGNYDIYVSYYSRSRWSEPENLGPKINTRFAEVMPYYHDASRRLYFSSRGLGGVGKHDIFYSIKIEGAWNTPVNLGEPVNSKQNDYGISFNESLDNGYFVTERNRTADIYTLTTTFPDLSKCSELKKNLYCFTFYEKGSINIDTTTLRYEWDFGDGTTVRGLEARHCFKGPGKYIIQLNVVDTLTGEVYLNEAFYEFKLEDAQQAYINCPDSAYVNQELLFDGSKSFIKDFTINNYYWNFGDFNKAIGTQNTYSYAEPGTYKVILGVTDNSNRKEQKSSCSYKLVKILSQPK